MKKDPPMKFFMTFLPVVLAGLILAFSSPAQAQKVTKISEGKVRAYYSELPGLFKKPYDQFLSAYGERIHQDLTLTTQTQILVPGQPPAETEPLTLTKGDLVSNAERAYKAAKDAVLGSEIKDIQISADGKSARVKTVSTIRDMNFPTSDESPMKADSLENCDDEIVLNDSGTLQIIKSSCVSQITIKK